MGRQWTDGSFVLRARADVDSFPSNQSIPRDPRGPVTQLLVVIINRASILFVQRAQKRYKKDEPCSVCVGVCPTPLRTIHTS